MEKETKIFTKKGRNHERVYKSNNKYNPFLNDNDNMNTKPTNLTLDTALINNTNNNINMNINNNNLISINNRYSNRSSTKVTFSADNPNKNTNTNNNNTSILNSTNINNNNNNSNNINTNNPNNNSNALSQISLTSPTNMNLNLSNSININTSKFFSKVIVENIPSQQKIMCVFEQFITENKIPVSYGSESIEPNTIIFTFDSEEVAFNFTKTLNYYKNNNNYYNEISVRLSLIPNKKYGKAGGEFSPRKRGLSSESILKLFQGNSYVRKVKVAPKIESYVHVGERSPFIFKDSKKLVKNRSDKLWNKNYNNLKNYQEYKNYNINVLNTQYRKGGVPPDIHRTDNKEKWVSPENFKLW